jgi:hypothetical protein
MWRGTTLASSIKFTENREGEVVLAGDRLNKNLTGWGTARTPGKHWVDVAVSDMPSNSQQTKREKII